MSEWSEWYLKIGKVDFSEILTIGIAEDITVDGDLLNDLSVQEYRIELGDVRVIRYNEESSQYFYKTEGLNVEGFFKPYNIGHDPHNKIIIVSDKRE